MAVAVKNFLNFGWSRFLIIRQNVNMATNAIFNSGLTPRYLHDVAIAVDIYMMWLLPQIST